MIFGVRLQYRVSTALSNAITGNASVSVLINARMAPWDKEGTGFHSLFGGPMASIHLYFARKQVGDTQKRGKPEMRSSCRMYSICTDRRQPGPAAALQVSPTSDTCQSVAILMNRPHSEIRTLCCTPFNTKISPRKRAVQRINEQLL